MEDKKVSIVLPVYNGADYIIDSIESIVAQTYQNWELIIVNDCSTDNTLTICEKYAMKDNRIRVISNPVNLKLPNTLNAGFDVATGDYYTWTSDDNMYRPKAMEVLVRTLRQSPELVMVYSDYTNIDAEGNFLDEVKLQDSWHIFTGNVCGACFLYTAEVAKKVGRYDANLFLAEDYDYWMRIYRYGKIQHIADDLYLYRRHAGSLTETRKASIQEQTYKAIEKNFLPLYTDAKRNGFTFAFFDQMIKRGQANEKEVEDMLKVVNSKYSRYKRVCRFKESVKEIIRGNFMYRFLQKMKGTIS